MEFRKKILENSLSIIGELNDSAKSAAVGFFIKTGSRDENTDINGVSHFLEHMLFKGTEKLSAIEVSKAFDKTGADFNAGTGWETTIYHAAVLPEYLEEITNLWIELMRPALRDEDFNIEKEVIKQEIAMYNDVPEFVAADKCRSLHFNGHPCGNSVLGSVKSIDNLSAEQMREYFNRRYTPDNMAVVCVGNFNWEKICSLVQNGCGGWQSKGAGRITEDFEGSKKKKRTEKSNINREHICLMSRGVPARDERRFAAHLLAAIIGDSVGSRFFWELIDKALAEMATMQFGAMDGTGIFFSQIQCSSDNREKVMDVINRIFRELGEKGVGENELQKAKNKILSALVIKNEVPMGRMADVGFNWMYLGKYRTTADDVEAIKSVTVQQVCSLVKQLSPGEYTQFSIGPVKSS